MNVSLESGNGLGYTVAVTEAGSLQTEVGNTVTTQRIALSIYRTLVSAGTSSGQLVGQRAGRQSIWIQNGANPAHVRFANAGASTSDWLIPAGGEFKAENFTYVGIITVITTGGSSNMVVLEQAP
jgi:hypothetical protein